VKERKHIHEAQGRKFYGKQFCFPRQSREGTLE